MMKKKYSRRRTYKEKRTIKRYSRPLNKGKWQTVVAIADAYARQKDLFLGEYGLADAFGRYEDYEEARDLLVAQKYDSPPGLQSRMWKMALKDAFETVDRQWLALAEELRPLVMRQQKSGRFNKTQAHYAFWMLTSSRRMAQLISGAAPVPSHFSLEPGEGRQVVNYLRRIIHRARGRNPRVKLARSFALDAEMYTPLEKNGRQYLSVMTLIPRQRVTIPLTGTGKIEGNLRIVLDFDQQRIEVQRAIDLKPGVSNGPPLAVDFGITEVMTDSDGDVWGEGFGDILIADSEALNRKGQRRNRLHALRKKAHQQKNRAKARRIRKFNLGRKKQGRQRRKMRDNLARVVNTAMNQLWRKKKPTLVIYENLRSLGGKFKSKRLSRLVSLWTNGLIKDRLEFKASAGSSRRQQTTSSYSSQRCPACWFIHPRNRKGDSFKCLFCEHGGHSDRVAAWNLLEFGLDAELAFWMPKEQVKAILLSRFRRRLESWDFSFSPEQANFAVLAEIGIPATVPGPDLSRAAAHPLVDGDGSNSRAGQERNFYLREKEVEPNLHR